MFVEAYKIYINILLRDQITEYLINFHILFQKEFIISMSGFTKF